VPVSAAVILKSYNQSLVVIASAAKKSSLDRRVASLLAMTGQMVQRT
jgi:hypothetical protein